MAALALAACTPVVEMGGGWRVLEDAPQVIYREGVPHTDAQGRPRNGYDPEVSFFPVGIYHGLTGTFGEIEYGFAPLVAAGFNTVVAWGGLKNTDVLDAARDAGLQVVMSLPSDETVRLAKGHPNVLAFDVDHEPSFDLPGPAADARVDRFLARRAQIRAIDPDRAVFVVDSPTVSAPHLDLWRTWKRAGDVASFFSYPVTDYTMATLDGREGVGPVTSLAVEASIQQKPVWYVAQAFESRSFGWLMPDERQARSMAYTGLVHGATGIIWFGFDSFVTRNGLVTGIGPEPLPAYETILPGSLVGATPFAANRDVIGKSKALWRAVVALNREITELRDVWLSPAAAIDHVVDVRGEADSETPVRTVLKAMGPDLVLVVVSVDDRSLEFRVRLDDPILTIDRLAGDARVTVRDGLVIGSLDGFGTAVLKLTTADR
ncbi:MAG: hypothetical protein ABJ215_00815 [Alphaproteobacteria bacterium]